MRIPSHFRISANLFCVLRHVRLSHQKRALWADAICIDQANCVELGRQVRLMHRIYSQARRTLIYPGTMPPWLAQATTDLVYHIYQFLTDTLEGYQKGDWPRIERMKLRHVDLAKLRSLNYFPLDTMFRMRWFSRLWVLQEVALSKDPIVLLGSNSIPWDTLADVIYLLRILEMHRNLPPPSPPFRPLPSPPFAPPASSLGRRRIYSP